MIVADEEALRLSGWEGATGQGAGGTVVLLERGDGSEGRVVAPAGQRLWRRSPWPVHDALFDLPSADSPSALVVGNAEVAERLRALGQPVDEAERLTVDGLRAATVVVLLAGHGALPAPAFCVLAARRVLVADAVDATFGLQDGIEFLRGATPDEAVERANIALTHPRSVAGLRALGARAAAFHRASLAYPRMAADLV